MLLISTVTEVSCVFKSIGKSYTVVHSCSCCVACVNNGGMGPSTKWDPGQTSQSEAVLGLGNMGFPETPFGLDFTLTKELASC